MAFGAIFLALALLLPGRALPLGSLFTALSLVLGVGACYGFGAWLFCASFEKSKSLRYAPTVPHVIEPETEASNLLRASDDRAALARYLLRTSQIPVETEPRELLRVHIGTPGDAPERSQIR